MYLTRMELNTQSRATMRALISPNLFHGAVERAFPGERERNLWRIDKLNGRLYLMILSNRVPELDSAIKQFGYDDGHHLPETRDYQPLLDRIAVGSMWRFRLKANPTVCKKDEGIRAHITPAYQKKWLTDRAEANGFTLSDDRFDVVASEWYHFFKGNDGGRPVTILSVTFEGLLTVTDADLFRQALAQGIGREKAYGMGLLTVIR